VYVWAVILVLSSNPPVAVFAPLQALDAVQLVGLPVVVQVNLVALVGNVIEAGLAERETEMGFIAQVLPLQVVPDTQLAVTVL
jgi:hypothetical protein